MSWKPLKFSAYAGTHLPPLLISATFALDSYSIHLTDLTHIWSESLTKRAIIRRSQEENTSIDPSDGDQFKIFLDKLKLGLEGGKDTTLALTITADADRPSLILNITTNLPGGLAPLEWPVRLAAAPQSVLASQLTLPLLRAQQVRIREIAALAEVLKEKDHVIQKLADKLEEQGTELGQVFPQAAGKVGRKVDRKRAEERVKGLGVFDMQTWRKGLSHEEAQDTAQLIGEIFTGDNTEALQANNGVPLSEEQDSWWESIKGVTVNLNSGKISTNGVQKASKAKPSPKPVLRQEESIDDDAFQVQATPPHLATSSRPGPSKAIIDDSTDDEDDLDGPSQRSKIPDSFPSSQPAAAAPPAKPKKFGTIGGKKAAPKPEPLPQVDDDQTTEEEPSPQKASLGEKKNESPAPQIAAVRPKKTVGKIGGKKEAPPPPEPEPEPDSETEPEVEASPPPVVSPPKEVAKPKKGKLGQIGGKKKQAEHVPEPAEPEVSTAAAPSAKRKLGQIGHGHMVERQESPRKPEEGNNESRGRAPVKPEQTATPEPRETSLERADKKRERLRRELEEKAKAPVKKKRKF
jgi:hypothetical protein